MQCALECATVACATVANCFEPVEFQIRSDLKLNILSDKSNPIVINLKKVGHAGLYALTCGPLFNVRYYLNLLFTVNPSNSPRQLVEIPIGGCVWRVCSASSRSFRSTRLAVAQVLGP